MSTKKIWKISIIIVGIISEKKLKTLWQKGEIARFEQFLILSQCFQKSSAADFIKMRLQVGKG